MKAGTNNWQFNADTTQAGNFSIQMFVTDANGSQSNILTAAFQVIHPAWETMASMPTARTALGAAVVNNMLYAIGGRNGAAVNTVEAYDPSTDTWTSAAAAPTARDGVAVAAVNGKIYVVGEMFRHWRSTTPAPTPGQRKHQCRPVEHRWG